jgi:hypothetical protein
MKLVLLIGLMSWSAAFWNEGSSTQNNPNNSTIKVQNEGINYSVQLMPTHNVPTISVNTVNLNNTGETMPMVIASNTTNELVVVATNSDNKADIQRQETTCLVRNDIYQAGEKLTYKLYYNWTAMWMNAGSVNFTIQDDFLDGRVVQHIVSEGKTAKAFDWFFKVHDIYETYIDPQTMLPVRFVRNVKEGDYTKNNLFSFDHNNNEVFVHHRKRMGKLQVENETLTIPSCTQDLLSSIYYTRCIDYDDMEVGDKFMVDLFIDGEIVSAYLRYLGKDELKMTHGKYRCVKFAPSLLESDIFDEGESMVIWATDDANRMPLLIESKLKMGSIKAYLTNFDGLKYDFTSKIK